MSIRAIWVIRGPSSPNQNARFLFFRKFPTVEKKARLIGGDDYVPLPRNPRFIQLLLTEVGLMADNGCKFIASRDSCKRQEQKPVFEVDTSSGKLWPVVVIEQFGILFCCLPLVEQGLQQRPPLIEIPAVSLGFSLLCGMSDFLRTASNQELSTRLSDLHSFVNEAAPFGVPRDTCCESLMAKLANRPISLPKTQKQPAWKPLLYKGHKANIYLAVSECIKASQCEQGESQDSWEVYGTVSCKAEIDGAVPDITLNISHTSDGDCVPLDHLLIHPCVQSADSGISDAGGSGRNSRPTPRRIRFIPPAEMFTLCHYMVSRLQELPIFGVYQMKCDQKNVNFSIKLKLSDQVKNNFEYCELQVPFYNRGSVSSFDSSPSQGSTVLSPDRKILVWNIGQKFPSKSLEVSLSASLVFPEVSQISTVTSAEELFCRGKNAYAQLYFKIPEFTHSGCYIDPKSIQVSPSTKFKLTTVREYFSADYKIWNSYGDVLTTTPNTSTS